MLLLALLIGWQAKVHFTHDPPRKSGVSDGAIHVSGSKVRIDEGEIVVLFDGRKLLLLFPAQKQFLELPASDAPMATVPPLSLKGMKPVGAETIDGVRCTIRERTAGEVHQRLWVPDDNKKNFFFLRAATVTPRGATRMDLSDVKQAPQPDALFRIPRDYRRKGTEGNGTER